MESEIVEKKNEGEEVTCSSNHTSRTTSSPCAPSSRASGSTPSASLRSPPSVAAEADSG